MRDLLFKNLTCPDRNRRIIASSEIADKEGIHSVVRRHFACIIKPIDGQKFEKPAPYLYVIKERNTLQKKERFFCKVKGSLIVINRAKPCLILFVHTLSVELTASEKTSEQIN